MTAQEKRRLGIDATLNINMSEPYDYAAAVWATAYLFEELNQSEGWATGSGNNRGQPIEAIAKTRAQTDITGRLMCRDSDPIYKKLLYAFRHRDTEVDVMVLSGALDSEGAGGLRGKYQVVRFTNAIGPGDVQYRDVLLQPAIVGDDEPFVFADVIGGAIVFSPAYGNEP